jgi:hypothetical protein
VALQQPSPNHSRWISDVPSPISSSGVSRYPPLDLVLLRVAVPAVDGAPRLCVILAGRVSSLALPGQCRLAKPGVLGMRQPLDGGAPPRVADLGVERSACLGGDARVGVDDEAFEHRYVRSVGQQVRQAGGEAPVCAVG